MGSRMLSEYLSSIGSRISEAEGGNFLTPQIAHTARRETVYREIGALIDAIRMFQRDEHRPCRRHGP